MLPRAPIQDTLRLVLDRAVEGVVVHDASGAALWCNASAARMLGGIASLSGAAAESAWRAIREDGSPLPWSDHPVMIALRSGTPQQDVVMGIAREDGGHRWLKVSADPVRREGEAGPGAVIASYTDMSAIKEGVTRLHALESQMRESQKMEAIGQLTGGIAHDFNNLLTAILTNADLIAGALPDANPEMRAELDDLRRAARRGAELVRKLTTFARRERLELVRMNLGAVLWDATRLLRRVVPEHIELVTQVARDVPEIQGDAPALEQVLVNLATNARDAMPRGGVLRIEADQAEMSRAECDALGWGRPGPVVRLTVTDTGIGMDGEILERIYEPFYTTKPMGEGTGLGMSIVYGIVQQHGAHVRVSSAKGAGTKVELRFLPAGADSKAAEAVDDGAAAPPGTETILLVEDNEGVRAAMRRILEHCGYRVVSASDGADALQLYQVQRGEIALVLADVVMPRLGGLELAAALRRQGSKVPIVLTSGYTERADEAAALGAPIFRKPWTPVELAREVRRALDGAPAIER